MGDVISTHLDEDRREMIEGHTGAVMREFGCLYEKQYAVALFNKVRFEVEGNHGPQAQLLHRKVAFEDKSIFSGNLFQYLEENKKWRNRFFFVPDSYIINFYENRLASERGLHPKGSINCAGYRVLTSVEQYMELVESTLPAAKAKASSSPLLKIGTQFPILLWHPYARHHYFCVTTEKEQQKWLAVFQDCIRHINNGLSEENKVQTPAFTDAVRFCRQAHGQYSTWDMMCGTPTQILANLVMERIIPQLKNLIAPRLKGKSHERQKSWMLISDAVYSLVQGQVQAQYEAVVKRCEDGRPALEATIRTDMDQIIISKELVMSRMSALVFPKAEELLRSSIQPYISSVLEELMEPTSRGFADVRDVFFRELVDLSKNMLNNSGKEKLGEYMEKISMLAFHPVKMQSCYEKVERLQLEGLQQRFDVSSSSIFIQRAQILMREQMDNAVYTFEQLLHQSLDNQGGEDLFKTIQRCQDRVIKKYDYDSSTVRKKFFREALLQIFIPYMLKQLYPSFKTKLPEFENLIFEDLSRFILVENVFEEVVLQSIMKDIMMAVKEAAVQRKHNLYRDSIVLTNSDPNLNLLGENLPIDWAEEFGGEGELRRPKGDNAEASKTRRVKQVVSMIQLDSTGPLPNETCLEVPGVDDIPEEVDGRVQETEEKQQEEEPPLTNGMGQQSSREDKEVPMEVKAEMTKEEAPPISTAETLNSALQDMATNSAIESAIQEIENAVLGEDEDQEPSKASPSSKGPEKLASLEAEPVCNSAPPTRPPTNGAAAQPIPVAPRQSEDAVPHPQSSEAPVELSQRLETGKGEEGESSPAVA